MQTAARHVRGRLHRITRFPDNDGVARGIDWLQEQGEGAALGSEEQIDRLRALGGDGADVDLAFFLVLLQHELAGVAGDLADAAALEADSGDLLLRDFAEHSVPVPRLPPL